MTNVREEALEHADEFLKFFRRGERFTRELLAEIERLRGTLADVEHRLEVASRDEGDWAKLRKQFTEQIRGLEGERDDAIAQLHEAQEENQEFAQRYVQVMEQNTACTNLYVASYSLHSTLELGEVLKVIMEIVVNLIGADVFAVFVFDETNESYEPLATEGVDPSDLPRVQRGAGRIGEAIESGEIRYGESGAGHLDDPLACIPLESSGKSAGAIAIFDLLSHKKTFTSLDRQLFTLLAGHAATAIVAAKAHGESERKLRMIRGAVNLLID